MPTRVRSYCKINLGLAIGPPRADGFHDLTTLYQTLEAHDLLTVTAVPLPGSPHRAPDQVPDRITLTCDHPRVPLDERNTVWKMLTRALLARRQSLLSPPSPLAVSVHIEKRLPVQGGLGAGSANAAAALLGFEQETGYTLPGSQRLRLAAEVGSDVPLFLLGGAVLGQGRGEQVVPLPDLLPDPLPGRPHSAEVIEAVLALPEVGVSTPQAFRAWDQHLAAPPPGLGAGLTREQASSRVEELSRALASAVCEPHRSSGVFPLLEREGLARHPLSALVRTGIRNDFEEVVFRQHPLLGTIKRALEVSAVSGIPTAGAPLYAALSGSGSALFGLYAGNESAEAAEFRVQALGVRTLRTRLLGRAAYWEQMFEPPS